MSNMTKTNYFVVTGAIGGGKSTVIREIRKAGIRCVSEPAREILAEQRSIDSDGVPEQNPELFCKLMLSRSLHNYAEGMDVSEVQVFDRGIPDMVAYAELFSIEPKSFYKLHSGKITLMDTMAGVPLYRACGYEPGDHVTDDRGGVPVPLLRMGKSL